MLDGAMHPCQQLGTRTPGQTLARARDRTRAHETTGNGAGQRLSGIQYDSPFSGAIAATMRASEMLHQRHYKLDASH